MCLNLGLHAKEEVEQLKNLKGKFIAYKLLEVDFNGKLISPFQPETKWTKGKTKVSNRTTSELTNHEIDDLAVFQGLHFYRTREDARKAIRGWNFYTQIWKVEIDPKDIVAIGYCFVPAWSSNKITSIVTHKAKLLERVR